MPRRILALLMAGAGLAWQPADAGRADFRHEQASAQARHVADWAVDSGDPAGLPFVVVDKVRSRVFVFDASGRLRGAAPALLGAAPGDDSVPGIGDRKMSAIRAEERTTPAGRFVASLEKSLHGDEILWVDYDAAIALHRVTATVPAERRLQRLASDVPADRRITYGCINVPVKFFDNVVAPTFRRGGGVVYVLPETRPAHEVFRSYDVAEPGAAAPASVIQRRSP
jgi:hypothetical protein